MLISLSVSLWSPWLSLSIDGIALVAPRRLFRAAAMPSWPRAVSYIFQACQMLYARSSSVRRRCEELVIACIELHVFGVELCWSHAMMMRLRHWLDVMIFDCRDCHVLMVRCRDAATQAGSVYIFSLAEWNISVTRAASVDKPVFHFHDWLWLVDIVYRHCYHRWIEIWLFFTILVLTALDICMALELAAIAAGLECAIARRCFDTGRRRDRLRAMME